MKPLIFTLLLGCTLIAHTQTNHLVISQVYGAGGNTGANYIYDYVELYNPTANPVSLAGSSLQYAGATSKNWASNQAALSGTVEPGKYFLIQLGNPGTEGRPLPTPDLVSSNISISTAGGKVALVNNTTTFTANCPFPNTAIVDFVGFGSADCFEGTAAATGPVTGNTTSSITRLNNGCTDVDNNRADFALMTASPRNSSANGHTCNGSSITVGAVTPNPFCVDANSGAAGTVRYTASGSFTNSTFNAVLSDADGSFGYEVLVGSMVVSGTNPSGAIDIALPANLPSGTGYKIRIEATNPPLLSATQSNAFEIINGAKNLLPNEFSAAANNTTITLNWINPTGCFDEILIVAKEGSSISGTPAGDGSAYIADLDFSGIGTPFDGGKVVYRGTKSGQTVTNLNNGVIYFFKAYTRRGTTWSSGTEVSEKPRVVPLAGELVINQLSPQYSGTATDEYFELVNVSDKPFDLSDVAIRVANGSGNTVVAGGTLSGIIQPHSFWLVSPNTNITVGQTITLPRDNSVDAGFATTNNQIGLVRKTDNSLLDAVAYGNISLATYKEGTAATNPPSRGGLKRKISGADNNNNSADFTGVPTGEIELRNSNSRLAGSGTVISGGDYALLEVTGNATLGGTATFSNKVVMTNGVFTLNDYDLTTAAVVNGTAGKYIKTTGTGALTVTNVNSDVVFPVGNSTYNPVTISNGGGLSWRVHVTDAIAPAATPFDKEYAIQRTWNVTPSSVPASGATLVFEYNDNDAAQLGKNFNKSKPVQVWSYHNGTWRAITGPQTPVAVAPDRKAVTVSNFSQFSPFVIVNVDAALPVHFTNFSVREQNGSVLIQFTNASERNVQQYVIERAADGKIFKTFMQLTPRKNDGSAVPYNWVDQEPLQGDAWYRVKGVDEDGTIRYTPVLKINTTHSIKALTIHPNPVQGRSVIWQAALPKGVYQVRIVDNKGQQVLTQTLEHSGGNYSGALNLPTGLASGVYYLQISNGRFVQRESFVVL